MKKNIINGADLLRKKYTKPSMTVFDIAPRQILCGSDTYRVTLNPEDEGDFGDDNTIN